MSELGLPVVSRVSMQKEPRTWHLLEKVLDADARFKLENSIYKEGSLHTSEPAKPMQSKICLHGLQVLFKGLHSACEVAALKQTRIYPSSWSPKIRWALNLKGFRV